MSLLCYNVHAPDSEILDSVSAAQIEKLPHGAQGRDINEIMSTTRLRTYAERLNGQTPEVEEVCKASQIKEGAQIFSKKYICELIVLHALAQKLELDALKVSKVITNKQGVLVVLDVKSPNANGDGGYRHINYTIKGRHGINNQATVTCIDETFLDKDDMPESGGTIADYLDGKWRFKK